MRYLRHSSSALQTACRRGKGAKTKDADKTIGNTLETTDLPAEQDIDIPRTADKKGYKNSSASRARKWYLRFGSTVGGKVS
jgi:hypothetical protein